MILRFCCPKTSRYECSTRVPGVNPKKEGTGSACQLGDPAATSLNNSRNPIHAPPCVSMPPSFPAHECCRVNHPPLGHLLVEKVQPLSVR